MSDHRTDREPLSDEEIAVLRHLQFGELPRRVRPEDRVELTETEPRRDLPEPEPWTPQG
jgi:hypothetical protein